MLRFRENIVGLFNILLIGFNKNRTTKSWQVKCLILWDVMDLRTMYWLMRPVDSFMGIGVSMLNEKLQTKSDSNRPIGRQTLCMLFMFLFISIRLLLEKVYIPRIPN